MRRFVIRWRILSDYAGGSRPATIPCDEIAVATQIPTIPISCGKRQFVESRRSAVPHARSASPSRSSNRTCGFPASGSSMNEQEPRPIVTPHVYSVSPMRAPRCRGRQRANTLEAARVKLRGGDSNPPWKCATSNDRATTLAWPRPLLPYPAGPFFAMAVRPLANFVRIKVFADGAISGSWELAVRQCSSCSEASQDAQLSTVGNADVPSRIVRLGSACGSNAAGRLDSDARSRGSDSGLPRPTLPTQSYAPRHMPAFIGVHRRFRFLAPRLSRAHRL